jgi:hypothetical protein
VPVQAQEQEAPPVQRKSVQQLLQQAEVDPAEDLVERAVVVLVVQDQIIPVLQVEQVEQA